MKPLGKTYAEAEVTGGDFQRLPVGGYVCRIMKVEDKVSPQKGSPYLSIIYDIAEGDYKDFYADDWGNDNEWAHESQHYYTPNAMGMFKGFLKAIDESNSTTFSAEAETGFDERKLIGLLVGYVIGEEEYEGNDGSVKTKLKVRSTKNIQAIRDGRFKMPETKKLAESAEPASEPLSEITDDDLPF